MKFEDTPDRQKLNLNESTKIVQSENERASDLPVRGCESQISTITAFSKADQSSSVGGLRFRDVIVSHHISSAVPSTPQYYYHMNLFV